MSSLPDGVRLAPGRGGLDRLTIDHAGTRAELYLHGATLTAWHPKNREPVLWLSRESAFQPDKAIRGGIPLCFPWFGPARSPQHGFARISPWSLTTARTTPAGVELNLELRSNDTTRAAWPHNFIGRYTVDISEKLELALTVENTGETRFRFEEALHTYFAVEDVRAITVRGLEDTWYTDKVAANTRAREGDAPIRITAETDRLYESTTAACELHDPGKKRRISIQKDASRTTILWNPWIDKARAMKDFGDDEWTEMVCIESANAAIDAVELAPGEAHTIRVKIVVNDA